TAAIQQIPVLTTLHHQTTIPIRRFGCGCSQRCAARPSIEARFFWTSESRALQAQCSGLFYWAFYKDSAQWLQIYRKKAFSMIGSLRPGSLQQLSRQARYSVANSLHGWHSNRSWAF